MKVFPAIKKKPNVKSPDDRQHVETVPAPIGGLNVRDPLNAMPPTDAFQLVNWIPQALGLSLRKGYVDWLTGLVTPIQSIFQYFASSSTISTTIDYSKVPTALPGTVFVATDAGIYNATTRGAVGAAVLALSGTLHAGNLYTNMFVNSGGSFLLLNSEIDGYITYDGATWLKVTMGAGATQINGVDPALLVFNLPWKNRVFFVQKSTSKLWYTATNALYGTVTAFDFGPLMKHGGAIAYIADWTIDAGTGIDDHLVIVGENGDVLVYKGTDPASASTFSLVGTWYIGEVPKGRRAWMQFGGDLLLLSVNGLAPVSYITRGGADFLQATNKEYTSKIQLAINLDVSTSFNQYGWEFGFTPHDNLVVLNTPNTASSTNKQYAMSTVTNQWTTFAGMAMSTVAVCTGYTLFGTGTGGVKLAFQGELDAVSVTNTGGTGVYGFVQPAFNSFGSTGRYKHFLMVRPVFLSSSPPSVSLQMNVDYASDAPIQSASFSVNPASAWDAAKWDIGKWVGNNTVYQNWYSVTGAGYNASAAMTTVGPGGMTLASIDYMMEMGGPM